MAPDSPEVLRDRGRSLEDEFFRREDKRLLAKLNELKAAEATRDALARASGITRPMGRGAQNRKRGKERAGACRPGPGRDGPALGSRYSINFGRVK